MGTFCKVIILGRLGKDADVRRIGESTVANFSLATDRMFTKNGEKQKQTDWHRVSIWGKTAENVGSFLRKGREVLVEGTLQTRSYKDDAGIEKFITEVHGHTIVLVGPRPDDAPVRRPVAVLASELADSDDPFTPF